MKRLLFIVLLCAPFAHGAISEVTSAECAASATSCTIGTTTSGQLILAFSYNSAAATAPTLPAGWTNIDNSTGNTNGERLGCKVAVDGNVSVTNGSTTVTWVSGSTFVTGGSWNGLAIVIGGTTFTISSVTSSTALTLTASYTGTTSASVAYTLDTSGTWTNATQLIILVFSGTAAGRTENCPFTMARVGASGGASSATIAYNTFTLFDRTGSSWVVGCAGHRTASNLTAPTGMTLKQSVGTGPMAACSDTNGGVSSWSTTTTGVNATSGWRSETIEILAPCGSAPCFDVYVDGNTGTAGDTLTTTNEGASTFFGLTNLGATPWDAPATANILTIQNHTAGVRELGGNFTADNGSTVVGASHTSKPWQFNNSTGAVTAFAHFPAGIHLVLITGWITQGVSVTSGGSKLWDMPRIDTNVTGHFAILQWSPKTNKCGTTNAGFDLETDPSSITTNSACLNTNTTPVTVWFNLYYDATGTASTGVAKIALYDTCANGGGQLANITAAAGADTGASNGLSGVEIGNAEFGTDAGSFNSFENMFFAFDRNALSFPIGPNCTAAGATVPNPQFMTLGVGTL